MERKPETYTDEELVQLFQQQHNRKALGLLYRRYAHLVLGLCLDYLKNREVIANGTTMLMEAPKSQQQVMSIYMLFKEG